MTRGMAYARLKEAILSGELAPGAPLVEASLAQWCSVSRTPIREALTRLEQDGLVARGERGLVVRAVTPGETLDIYETRIVLEALAARMAAERRTAHDLMLLGQATALMERMDTEDPMEMVRANMLFHRAIWTASHNESLIDLLERLHLRLGRYSDTSLRHPGRWAVSNDEHARLLRAVGERDAAAAGDAAVLHFTHARDIRLSAFDDTLI
jgi:DNA-binding GntR family transcriptional regulator